MQWGVQSRGYSTLFLQHEALHCCGRLQECKHPWRQMTDAIERKISEWQPPLRYWWGGEIVGWGRFCHWTDGEVCASIVILLALAVAVLTLVEFTQAARVAEGADRPRLPAAPALHPTFCSPVITPRTRRNAAQSHYIIQGVGGRHQLALFNTAVYTHITAYTQTGERCRLYLLQFLFPLLHCFSFFRNCNQDAHIQKAQHIYNSQPHASLSAEQIGKGGVNEGESEWSKEEMELSSQ